MLKINIHSNKLHTYKSNNLYFAAYGNINNLDELEHLKSFNENFNIPDFLLTLSGFFCIVIKYKKTTYICNDVFGNFRLYSTYIDNVYYISDSFNFLKRKLPKHKIKKFNSHEKKYLLRHSYTSAGKTILKSINKVYPASILQFTSKLDSCNYFDFKKYKINDHLAYELRNFNFIKNNIKNSVNQKLPTFLMFSGGMDSIFLFYCLRDLKINFTPVFIKYDLPNIDNQVDYQRSVKFCKNTNTKLKIVNFTLNESLDSINEMVKLIPTDIPFPASHFFQKKIFNELGKCNIISGQSSDSIYCWGNSSMTFGAFLQRVYSSSIFFHSPIFIRFLFSKFVKLAYKLKQNRLINTPYKRDEIILGMLDANGYIPEVINNQTYIKYLKKIIDTQLYNLDFKHKRLYLKMMYLQGVSNTPHIASAKLFDHNFCMPFLDVNILKNILINQNEFKMIFNPRYELTKIFKKHFNVDESVFRKEPSTNYKISYKKIKKFQFFNQHFLKTYLTKIYK